MKLALGLIFFELFLLLLTFVRLLKLYIFCTSFCPESVVQIRIPAREGQSILPFSSHFLNHLLNHFLISLQTGYMHRMHTYKMANFGFSSLLFFTKFVVL